MLVYVRHQTAAEQNHDSVLGMTAIQEALDRLKEDVQRLSDAYGI